MVKRRRLAFMLTWLASSLPLYAATLPLGAPDSWKYLAFDPATKRVFVAHGNEITVVDTTNLRIAGHVDGLSGAHGVAIVPGGHGYATSSKSAAVTVFDPTNLQRLATLKAGEDANSVTYDPASNHVFVANDDAGTLTIIDAATDTPIGTIALPGGEGLESAAADGAGHLFVNHSAQTNVVRVDTRSARVDASWNLPGCTKPQGLALDNSAKRLFISCENSRLLVLDQRDGQLVATLPIGPGSETVLFDARRQRMMTANADGTLSVFAVAGGDRYVPQAAVATAKGAHTAALDAATGTVYLVTADIDAQSPPRRHQVYSFVAGTVKLLAVEAK